MSPQDQSHVDKAIIKIRLIENAILVGAGSGWLSFDNWEKASDHIATRLAKLQSERNRHAI